MEFLLGVSIKKSQKSLVYIIHVSDDLLLTGVISCYSIFEQSFGKCYEIIIWSYLMYIINQDVIKTFDRVFNSQPSVPSLLAPQLILVSDPN